MAQTTEQQNVMKQQPQPLMQEQQSQLQNQYQQQAKMMNLLEQLQQHNKLQQPSQSQIQPTQLQSGSIQHSAQRQKQSPRYLQQPNQNKSTSFALPGTSDQLLPVNLAVNEAGASNYAEQPSDAGLKLYLEEIGAFVKRAAMKSFSIIQLSLKNYGYHGRAALVELNFLNAEAKKLAIAIDVVKVAETNTAQFVIDQMKKENTDAQITQILEEIGEECADFERHMKARTAREVVRMTNFLMAFARLYNKLYILLNNAFEPNALQGESEFKQLLDWTEKMKNEIYKKLRDLLKQNDEASKWCVNFFRLSEAIETAKLAFLMALPMSSTNEWIKNGFGWSVLDEIMLSRIKLEESLEYCDDKLWIGSNYMNLIRKHIGYAAKNNIKFSDYALNKLVDFLSQIVLSINPLIQRQESNEPKQAQLCNLVLFPALFRKLIADFETPDYDVIWLTKLKDERKSALKILKLSVMLLDAKFKKEFETISKLDRIRTGILSGEGSNSK
uniref:Uncharacterized protein n=1 Tax=Globodera rostochiensis TaxID=31243 RepID=A0A914I2E5_GLORO